MRLAEHWVDRPVGCSIDVVDLGDEQPDWRVVECNDGFALGSYGLHPQTTPSSSSSDGPSSPAATADGTEPGTEVASGP